jgi:hypothetical protein
MTRGQRGDPDEPPRGRAAAPRGCPARLGARPPARAPRPGPSPQRRPHGLLACCRWAPPTRPLCLSVAAPRACCRALPAPSPHHHSSSHTNRNPGPPPAVRARARVSLRPRGRPLAPAPSEAAQLLASTNTQPRRQCDLSGPDCTLPGAGAARAGRGCRAWCRPASPPLAPAPHASVALSSFDSAEANHDSHRRAGRSPVKKQKCWNWLQPRAATTGFRDRPRQSGT